MAFVTNMRYGTAYNPQCPHPQLAPNARCAVQDTQGAHLQLGFFNTGSVVNLSSQQKIFVSLCTLHISHATIADLQSCFCNLASADVQSF